jgi:hypothetical protein
MGRESVPRMSASRLLEFLVGERAVSKMRGARRMAFLVLGASLLSSFATTASHAITCTDRQQVCFRYCEKTYANVPRCKATCAQLLSDCMSSGCWESKVTARQCGITKQ